MMRPIKKQAPEIYQACIADPMPAQREREMRQDRTHEVKKSILDAYRANPCPATLESLGTLYISNTGSRPRPDHS